MLADAKKSSSPREASNNTARKGRMNAHGRTTMKKWMVVAALAASIAARHPRR
jgi:hypothetical protein